MQCGISRAVLSLPAAIMNIHACFPSLWGWLQVLAESSRRQWYAVGKLLFYFLFVCSCRTAHCSIWTIIRKYHKLDGWLAMWSLGSWKCKIKVSVGSASRECPLSDSWVALQGARIRRKSPSWRDHYHKWIMIKTYNYPTVILRTHICT